MALRREFGVEMDEVRSALEVWAVCRDHGLTSGAEVKKTLEEGRIGPGAVGVVGDDVDVARSSQREGGADKRGFGDGSNVGLAAVAGVGALTGAGLAAGAVLASGALPASTLIESATTSTPLSSTPSDAAPLVVAAPASTAGFERVQELQVRDGGS